MPRAQRRKAVANVNYIDESEDEITESTTNYTKSAITKKISIKSSEPNTDSRKRRNPSTVEIEDNLQNDTDSSAKKTKVTRGRKPVPKKAATERKKAVASEEDEMEVDQEENNKKEEDKENLKVDPRSKKSVDKQTRSTPGLAVKDGNMKDETAWKEKYDELKRDYDKQAKKYEALKILKETEVERNFSAYKKVAENQIESLKDMTNQMQIEKKKLEDDNEHLQGEIATLKKELGKQAKTKIRMEESAHSKGKNGVNVEDDEIAKMRKECTELWKKNNELQEHVKFLEKQNAAEVENSKKLQTQMASLSTLKSSTVTTKNANKNGAPSNNNLEEVHNLKRMRTLYEDVTGLVIHTFKLDEEGGCTFNIHQTGRNGTVQFHLSESVDSQNLLIYHPILDHSRDQRIIEILPGYLQEDIEFERGPNSTMFFWRLLNFLQKDHTAGKK